MVFLFAGQGSQYIGMGKDLYDAYPQSRAVFEQADKELGFSLSKLCFQGDPEILKLTSMSQPAILTVSIAAYEAFKARVSEKAAFLAGLSLGEYSALIAAGSMSFANGLRLVRKRAEIMEEAVRKYPGKMAAVLELPLEQLKSICLSSGTEIANLNAPGQVVITGKKDAIEKAKELCLQAGAKRVIELEVSGAFHSSLMLEASVELKSVLYDADISAPIVPVISNYTALPQFRIDQIRENLVCQLYSSVKWEDSMRYLLSQGESSFYEFGPGKVLKGLMRRIEPNMKVTSIEKAQDIESLA